MKTGLYFGSFNPVHIGHMAIANYMVEFTGLDEVWFVISPHNPLKKKESLLADHFRLDMVEMAIAGDERLRCCDIELHMPRPSYTVDTLTYLRERYPRNELALIMGADGLSTFHKWKNYELIEKNVPRFVYPRAGIPAGEVKKHKNIFYAEDAPLIQLSSSWIREGIKRKHDLRHFLPGPVHEYIKTMQFYR